MNFWIENYKLTLKRELNCSSPAGIEDSKKKKKKKNHGCLKQKNVCELLT